MGAYVNYICTWWIVNLWPYPPPCCYKVGMCHLS